ncbi:hypothetical protein PMIN06_009110 [Paraphaeosphaeria minitans]
MLVILEFRTQRLMRISFVYSNHDDIQKKKVLVVGVLKEENHHTKKFAKIDAQEFQEIIFLSEMREMINREARNTLFLPHGLHVPSISSPLRKPNTSPYWAAIESRFAYELKGFFRKPYPSGRKVAV